MDWFSMKFLTRGPLRIVSIFLLFALVAASCGGGGEADDATAAGATEDQEVPANPTPPAIDESQLGLLTADELEEELDALPTATPLPTVDPALFATPIPTPEQEPDDPWEVYVLTAKSDTKIVPTFDGPDGNPFQLQYEYLNGDKINYDLRNPTYFGNDLALLVVEGRPGDDTGWAKVQLPVRPAGATAWVQTAFFDWSSHNYHIDIDITNNHVKVWKGEELIIESDAVSGKDSAPTPVVTSYIDEMIPGPNAAYGTWILSIAAFSETLNVFSEGLPKLALHGTNTPDIMGEFASSGCVRVPNDIIELIQETVPVGTQVKIFK